MSSIDSNKRFSSVDMKILLIEDELKVSRFIQKGLQENHFDVEVAFDGQIGIRMALAQNYDLIILDVVLPHHNGFEVCKRIREADSATPILMLTALGTLQDKVQGLDQGADDYLTKPFHFQELLARIRALTRRSSKEKLTGGFLRIEDLEIDTSAKTVRRGESLIDLTAREFRLLEMLVKNKNRVLSRAEIAEKIWEQSFDSGSNVIDVYVNYLRKKVDQGFERKLIHTVIGMGYVVR